MASKKSKTWSSLRGTLPAAPVDPSHAALVADRKAAWSALPDADLYKRFAAAKAAKAAAQDAEREANADLAALSDLILARFEAANTESARTSLGLFNRMSEPYPQVEDPVALNAWLDTHGYGHQRAIPWGTLRSLVKDALRPAPGTAPQDLKPMPAGVKVYMKDEIRLTK